MTDEYIQYYVPSNLRKKYVSSKVSREIFFIDCINDLNNCVQSELSYDLIRSSVLLRMLLLEGGLKAISKGYNISLSFTANENEIQGTPFTKKEVRAIKEIETDKTILVSKKKVLMLKHLSSKNYSIDDFNDKICLMVSGRKDYCFSVSNIIELVANKHGAAHLESTFDSSTSESWSLGDYSPFSITDDSFFLKKIKEIILILIESLDSLIKLIQDGLLKYDVENPQGKISKIFTLQ